MAAAVRLRTALVIALLSLLAASVIRAADPEDALQQAASLVQQGRLEEAARQARLALDDPATRPVAYSVLGTIRFQQKRLDDSVRLLREAIRLEPRLIGAHLSLGQVYLIQGKPTLARPLFERVIALDASNIPARIALARLEAEQKHFRAAVDLASPVLPAFKSTPDGLTVLAASYLNLHQADAARELADDWLRLPDPPSADSTAFAVILLKGGLSREALRILERANSTAPPSYELAFNLAGAYLVTGDENRALAAYDLAASLRPDDVAALRQAAVLAEKQGNLERALSYWVRARKAAPADPDVLFAFGRICFQMDLLDDAEPALTKAAELRPGDLPNQYALAAVKVGKRQFEAAQALLEPLVVRHPGDARLQYALGAVLYSEGRLPDAATHLRASLALEPNQLPARYYLALVARDEGHDAEAIEALQTLLARYPDHAPSNEVLGGLLMTARQYDEAEKRLREAVRLNPSSVKANYQLGLLLSRMGRKEEAESQLALAKTLRADDEASSRLQLRLLDQEQ